MNGIVFGILDSQKSIDVSRTSALVDLAHPLPATFHRAFDDSPNLFSALEAVIQTGATRILTSGGHATAAEGASTLSRLVTAAAGRIIIMPAAGITAQNVATLIRHPQVREVHASLGAAIVGRTAKLNSPSPLNPAMSSEVDRATNVELLAFENRVRTLVVVISKLDG
jgi:copper homeostasis protein